MLYCACHICASCCSSSLLSSIHWREPCTTTRPCASPSAARSGSNCGRNGEKIPLLLLLRVCLPDAVHGTGCWYLALLQDCAPIGPDMMRERSHCAPHDEPRVPSSKITICSTNDLPVCVQVMYGTGRVPQFPSCRGHGPHLTWQYCSSMVTVVPWLIYSSSQRNLSTLVEGEGPERTTS